MALPSLHRVPRGGFPCFCGTIQHSDFLPAVSSGFVAFTIRYHPSARLLRSRRGAGTLSAAGRGVVIRVPLPGFFVGGADRTSQVPGGPLLSACPGLRPRRNPATVADQMTGWCLPISTRRRLPRLSFRGSIAQPTDSLCTLRSMGCPSTTQHSVPAAGTLGRAGLLTCRVPIKSFNVSPHIPSFQAWPGARGFDLNIIKST